MRAVRDHERSRRQPALSYEYQFHCPNDQNLIAVMGASPAQPIRLRTAPLDRHGIPDLGRVRCNLQIEGSGVAADDVVIDAGARRVRRRRAPAPSRTSASAPTGPTDRAAKHQGPSRARARHLRARDRRLPPRRLQDLLRGRVWRAHFVEDHGVNQNCEAAGNGDSGCTRARVPTRAPSATARRAGSRYPGAFRYSQEIRYCDSHHNASGYSGTDGNSTHLHHNNFYDNTLGFTTDVFTAARPARLPAGLGPGRVQQLLLEQLQYLMRRARDC